MASRPALLATSPVALGRAGHLRRTPRPPGGRNEPGRCPAVDPLARSGHPWAAGGRQRLLHGMSFPRTPNPRPPLAAGTLGLAAAASEQMAGGAPDRRLPV